MINLEIKDIERFGSLVLWLKPSESKLFWIFVSLMNTDNLVEIDRVKIMDYAEIRENKTYYKALKRLRDLEAIEQVEKDKWRVSQEILQRK